MDGSSRDRAFVAAAVVAPAVCFAVVAPFGEQPINDDWQMYWSAFRFAQTGEVRIPDYSAMGMVGWTVPAGFLARWTGESMVALRCLTMATLVFTGWAAYRFAREFALAPAAALALSLTVTLSPVLFWLSTTFMTDAPWNALFLTSLWLFARGLRTGRALDLALGAAAAAWAAWIRIPVVAIPIALFAATRIARTAPGVSRRTWAAAAAVLVAGVGGFTVWYEFVHGSTSAFRLKAGADLGAMARGCPGGAFASLAYAGLFLLPLAPLALARAGGARRGAAIAAAAVGAVALVQAATGCLGLGKKSMPYLPNVVSNLGLGPMTLTDVLREGGDPPVALPGVVQVVAGTFFAALGAALVWIALRRVVASFRARDDARVPFVAVAAALYLVAAILSSKTHAPLFDRYLVPLIAPLAVILLLPDRPGEEPRPPRDGFAGGAATGVLILAAAAFSTLGSRDYHRFTEARFDLADEAVALAGSTGRVDGGFEFNYWHNYEAAQRGEFRRARDWKGWLVADPVFVVATRERPGYEVVARRPLLSLVGAKRWDLLLLRRR